MFAAVTPERLPAPTPTELREYLGMSLGQLGWVVAAVLAVGLLLFALAYLSRRRRYELSNEDPLRPRRHHHHRHHRRHRTHVTYTQRNPTLAETGGLPPLRPPQPPPDKPPA
jgi:hypothetical protein